MDKYKVKLNPRAICELEAILNLESFPQSHRGQIVKCVCKLFLTQNNVKKEKLYQNTVMP